MWIGVDPTELCDQHLLGEHCEILKAVGGFLHHPYGIKITYGQAADLNIDLAKAADRLDKLRVEMLKRGMNPDLTNVVDTVAAEHHPQGGYCSQRNRDDLAARCADCRRRMDEVMAE